MTKDEAAQLEQQTAESHRARRAAEQRRPERAAGRRRRIGRRRGQRRRLQQFLDRLRHAVLPDRRPEADVDHRRSAGRARAGADAAGARSGPRRDLRVRRPTRRKTIRGSKGPAPTTIPSAVRSASAACWGSAPRPDRPRCRCSTTICIRSCRRRLRDDPQRDGSRRAHHPHRRQARARTTIRNWLGDSIGHWEGDTLVVDTTNFSDKTRFRGSSPNLHVIERFSRLDAKTLRYQFTIDDPATWVRPWTGEAAWPATTT